MLTKNRSKEIAMSVGKILSEPTTEQSYPMQRFDVKFDYSNNCKSMVGCKSRPIKDNSTAPTTIPENEDNGFSMPKR